ncbi:MAG: sigma-70 family RNA polymerase sigma factor [bacterium]
MKKTDILEPKTDKKNKYNAFEEIILPHKSILYGFALKMTGNEEDAEDLLQETFLKAFRFFDKFEQGTNAKAWLFSIMRNTFINEYRKNQREPNKVDYDDVQNFYENIKSSEVQYQHVVQDGFSNVLDDEITAALGILPADFQTIVILADIEGFTYEEIAEFVNCPVGTVRSRLHRARKMLYSKLYDYAKDKGFVERELEKV